MVLTISSLQLSDTGLYFCRQTDNESNTTHDTSYDLTIASQYSSLLKTVKLLKPSHNYGVSPNYGVTQFFLQPDISQHTPLPGLTQASKAGT